MKRCIITAGHPHRCKGYYTCDHGMIFRTHRPNGQPYFASDYCPDCRKECKGEQAKADGVAHELAAIREGTGR